MRGAVAVALLSVPAWANALDVGTALTADQVVSRNIAARGGMEAWAKVRTLVWVGHLQSLRASVPSMPFVLEQKLPNKTRFELNALNERTMRVFDGEQGWKVRQGRGGMPETVPYSAQEVIYARQERALDGDVVDAALNGSAVALEGSDQVDGRTTYRLAISSPSGDRHHVWIDAQTFLDVKSERNSYGAGGVARPVIIFYRDYKEIDGLMLPSSIETASAPGAPADKMVIERVTVNAVLDDRMFMNPASDRARRRPTRDVGAGTGDVGPAAGSMSSSGAASNNVSRADVEVR